MIEASKYTQQIIEKCEDGTEFKYSGKSMKSFIELIFKELEESIVASSGNNVFVWKEDGSGVESLQSFLDGYDMIDINDDEGYQVLVIKK